MGSTINGIYIPTDGEAGWGSHVSDNFTRQSENHINVKAYSAKGDGVTDDTAAITAAVTAWMAVANGGELFFPPGQYKITDTLTIGAIQGKTIRGAGRSSGLLMTVSNKPILKFNADATHSNKVCDLLLKYSTMQTSQTASNAVEFNSTTSATFYLNEFKNLWISNPYNGIASTGTNPQVFASRFDGIVVNPANSAIDFSIGSGNTLTFGYLYISGTGATGQGTAIRVDGNSPIFRQVTIQAWWVESGKHLIHIAGSDTAAVIDAIHVESCQLRSASTSMVYVTNGPLVVRAANFGSNDMAGGINAWIFEAASGGNIEIQRFKGDWAAHGTSNLGLLQAVNGDSSKAYIGFIESAVNITVPGLSAATTNGLRWGPNGHAVITTAQLPSAGASEDGTVLIEDAGAGDRNLIIYGGGQRFRIDGGASF